MMGILAKLVGGQAVNIVDGITGAIDKFVETPEEKQAAKVINEKLRQRPSELQVELNKIEAGHRTVFVAGWRPFIGWVCGIGLLVPFVVNPVLQWATGDPGPQMPVEHLMPLVVALLGLGAYREFGKWAGKTK